MHSAQVTCTLFSEQKTAHSGLAATGNSRKGQDSNQSPSRINQYRHHLWWFFHYLLAHFAHFFIFVPHLMRWHRGAPSGEGWQTCRRLQDRRKTGSCGLEAKRRKSRRKAGLKSDGEQTGVTDDQCGPGLMRPCRPGPRLVQQRPKFLLTAPLSLILFAFSPLGLIVGFNYLATKWHR